MATLADVNPVAEVLSWLQSHSGVLAAIGSPAHITGLAEPPYPHIRVEPSDGGANGDFIWIIQPELLISTLGDVDGAPGQSALRQIHHTMLSACMEMPRRTYVPGQTVVSRVVATSGSHALRTPLGSRGWVSSIALSCHPAP